MNINHYLIEGWRKCNVESPPYLFPDDNQEIIKSFSQTYRGFDEYAASRDFGRSSDKNLHIGLLPLPFAGNLTKASIFFLALNPGLSAGDYFAEEYNSEFRQAHIRNLKQENDSDEYPFIFLNPRFAWHPGFLYWHRRFRTIIKALAKQPQVSYQKAMSQLAQSLACLELLPYHSKSFGAGVLLKTLPSVQTMLAFVQDVVIPKVKDDEATIIVTRSIKTWRLPEHENIIVYKGGETRSAYLTPMSQEAIKVRLGLTRI